MLSTEASKSKQSLRPLALSLCLLSAVARLVPHPPNVTPVGGLSLFGGARLPGWQAYLMPLLVMSVTNPILAVLHGYPVYPKTTLFVYARLPGQRVDWAPAAPFGKRAVDRGSGLSMQPAVLPADQLWLVANERGLPEDMGRTAMVLLGRPSVLRPYPGG